MRTLIFPALFPIFALQAQEMKTFPAFAGEDYHYIFYKSQVKAEEGNIRNCCGIAYFNPLAQRYAPDKVTEVKLKIVGDSLHKVSFLQQGKIVVIFEKVDSTFTGVSFRFSHREILWNIDYQEFKNGKEHGLHLRWQRGDTCPVIREHFENGYRKGQFEAFYKTNQLAVTGHFKVLPKSSTDTIVTFDPETYEEKVFIENKRKSVRHGLWRYYSEKGRLQKEEFYRRGKLRRMKTYLPQPVKNR